MFQLFVLPDVNPVSLQLDLDRKFQLQGIMMDFKVRFLGGGSGMERDPGPRGLRPLGSRLLVYPVGVMTTCWEARPFPGWVTLTLSLYHSDSRGLTPERTVAPPGSLSRPCSGCICASSLLPLPSTHLINSALPSTNCAGLGRVSYSRVFLVSSVLITSLMRLGFQQPRSGPST